MLFRSQAVAPNEKAWSEALTSAMKVTAENRASDAKNKADFIAPLAAPKSNDESDWNRYLQEAFFRVDPAWKDGYPATKVLRLPQDENYQASIGFVRDALHDRLNRNGVVMIASPSQDNLVQVLSEITVTVPPGWLKKARVYVAVDDAHTADVERMLRPTGAKYVQLDPSKPIPQRKERLEAIATAQPRPNVGALSLPPELEAQGRQGFQNTSDCALLDRAPVARIGCGTCTFDIRLH